MKLVKHLSLILLISPMLFGCNNKEKEYIGIISAMDNEINLLLQQAKIDHIDTVGGIDYHVGTLNGKDVIISRSGIGKIKASSGITTMLDKYNVSNVIFTGIAGGTKDYEHVLDVVIGTRIVEHDYGRLSNDGFVWTAGDPAKGGSDGDYYYCSEKLVDLAYDVAVESIGETHVYKGTIATGDQFIANEEYCAYLAEKFDAYACEMEGASIAVVCDTYEVPYLIIRALSDKADGNAHESYIDFGDQAAQNSSLIVLGILEKM